MLLVVRPQENVEGSCEVQVVMFSGGNLIHFI